MGTDQPSLSVVTVVRNNATQIGAALQSVADQDYGNVEHVIVDGGSTDGTLEVVRGFGHVARLISESDRGLYDAINKGLRLATGEYVGLLHSDDRLSAPDVLTRVADALRERRTQALYGDIEFVNERGRRIRHYSGAAFRTADFARGMMPPHPSFYARRDLLLEAGGYDISYSIAADFELLLRLMLVQEITTQYLPLTMVTMRTGGTSTRGWRANVQINREILRACRANEVPTSLLRIYSKYFSKIRQFLPGSRPLAARR